MLPKIASDGEGGGWICWRDRRAGNLDIFVQHLGSDGKIQLRPNGIEVVDDASQQDYPRIISDCRGGAFLAWEDNRFHSDTYIFAQRLNRFGTSLWPKNGVQVSMRPGLFISLASDSVGGLLVAWILGGISSVTVQRLDSAGNRMWGDSGVVVSNRIGSVYPNDAAIVGDGKGGAFVAWSEGDAFSFQYDIYLQHLDPSGNITFPVNGVSLSSGLIQNIGVAVCADDSGGAIVSWASIFPSPRQDSSRQMIQRVSPQGSLLWGSAGLPLGNIEGGGGRRLLSDGKGGAYAGHSRFIQNLGGNGTAQWPGQGTPFTDAPTLFYNSTQSRDADKGIWNFWTYDAPNDTSGSNIFGQYIDKTGSIHWGNTGIAICAASGQQNDAQSVPLEDGHTIVVWDDFRHASFSCVFAARVDRVGTVDVVPEVEHMNPESFDLMQNFPNPFNPSTTLRIFLPGSHHIKFSIYDILGRIVTVLAEGYWEAGEHAIVWNGRNASGGRVASGMYFARMDVTALGGKSNLTKSIKLLLSK